MRKNILIAALVLPLISFSQKVDLDRFKFTCQYRTLPNTPLDTSFHTYDVAVQTTRIMEPYLKDMNPERSVMLDGWKRLDKNGHISIQIKFEDLLPEAVSVKEREEILKDKAGKETGRRYYYSQEVTYTFSALADITDFRGNRITSIELSNRNYKQVYRSPEFAVKQMAESYFMINTFTITDQLYKNCVNRAISSLSQQITSDYGFGQTTVTDIMWILDSKKHPEYQAHRNAFQTINEVLFTVSANRSLEGIREKLQPAITYFEGVKKRYSSTSKYDRKLRYASYYNLAVLYYYLDDPDAMQREASGLILNDFDAKDGRTLSASAMRLKSLFDQAKMNTRHFAIDTTLYKGPRETAGVVTKPREGNKPPSGAIKSGVVIRY